MGNATSTLISTLPDDAIVVRGGRNFPVDIRRSIGTHPSGITGVSDESAEGLSVNELAASIPHGRVGMTTVGEVRRLGGEVHRTAGRSPNQATLTGLAPVQTSYLLRPTFRNPARRC
jgi:hypothetical protein